MRSLRTAAFIALAPIAAFAQSPRAFHIPAVYHVGFWVHDVAKSRAFYHGILGYEEPYFLNTPAGALQMVVMKVNERQVIYQFNNASKILPNGDNLDHLGLEVDDLKALRAHLLSHGVTVKDVTRGRIGDFILTVKDPDGRTFEMTQFAPEGQLLKHQGQNLPAGRISSHLVSATIRVSDLEASLRFYRDVLGFRRVGEPGSDGSIRVQVPDGTDCLVLLPFDAHSGQAAPWAVPEYSLSVPDLGRAAAILSERAKATGSEGPSKPTLSAFGKRQISCLDPDGVRVVLVQDE